MTRVENVSGHRISQMHCGKEYIWEESGDVMTLDDRIAAWMIAKLNSADANPALKVDRIAVRDAMVAKGVDAATVAERVAAFVWVRPLPSVKGDQRADVNVVVAAKPAKVKDEPKKDESKSVPAK